MNSRTLLSLLPDSGHGVTGRLRLLLPRLPHHKPESALPSSHHFVRCFITVKRKVSNTAGVLSLGTKTADTQATRSLTTKCATLYAWTWSLPPKNGVGQEEIQTTSCRHTWEHRAETCAWQTHSSLHWRKLRFPFSGSFEHSSEPAPLSHELQFQSLTVNYLAANERRSLEVWASSCSQPC